MGTPIAKPATPRRELTVRQCSLDRGPQRSDLAFSGEQVSFVGRVPQDLPVAEVHQLQQGRNGTADPPHDQGVELQLKQGFGLEQLGRRIAGLVVDDAGRPTWGNIDTVDEAPQPHPVGEFRFDQQLPLGRLDAGWVFEHEVGLE
jgi:hypothetical protein